MPQDTETINRLTANYLQMAQYGLFVHDLRGYYLKGAFWGAQVSMLNKIEPELAKDLVTIWLTSTYDADSITFFRRTSDKPNQFRVQFNRKDC